MGESRGGFMILRAARCSVLLAVLISCLVLRLALAQEAPVDAATRLQKEAESFMANGEYEKGIDSAKRALALREKDFGAESREAAMSLHQLASLYRFAGRYESAQAAAQRAIALREKLLGPEHRA